VDQALCFISIITQSHLWKEGRG